MHRQILGITLCLAVVGGTAAQTSDDGASILPRGSARITSESQQASPRAGGATLSASSQDARLATPGRTQSSLQTTPFPVILPPGQIIQGATPAGAPVNGGGMYAPGCTTGEIHDDGTAENGLGACGYGTTIVVLTQFTPPNYPYSYDQVCLSWTQVAGDTALNYDIVMYDDDGASGGPGTFLGAIPVSASGIPGFPSVSPFFDYAVSFPTVSSGSVWIGARFDEAVENCFFVSADTSGGHPTYWSGDGGVSFGLDVAGPLNLLLRAEGSVTACGDGEIYDDGTAETGLGWNPTSGDVDVVSLFTPPIYPFTYDEVCLTWTQTSGDPTIAFDLVIYDDDGAAGGPGTLLASIPATATGVPVFPTVSSFYTYSFPGVPEIYNGSVWIGAHWNPAVEVQYFIGADTSGNHPDYHTSDGGATWTLDLGGTENLQIRAGGETVCAEGEIYDDGTAENGWGNAFTYIQVSQFTPVSYPFQYDQVCVGWTQTNNLGGTADLDYKIVIYDDDGIAGGPGTRLAELAVTDTGIPDFFGSQVYQYYTHTLDCSPVITSGSVWIGVDWDGISQPGRFLATDDSNNHPDYTNQNGTGFVLDVTGLMTYMIRAGHSGDGSNPTASATFRNAGSNPPSLSTSLPQLGSTLTMTVDLTTTGHLFGGVVAFASQVTLPLPGGQVLLTNVADPSGELLGLSVATGPIANFSVTVPIDLALCGFHASAQAVHVSGVQPFALSNAIDWVVGL